MVQSPVGINEAVCGSVPSAASQLTLIAHGFKGFPIEARGNYSMKRIVLAAAPLLFLVALPTEAEAQRGQNCSYEAQARRQAARNILGGIAGGVLGGVGGAAAAALPMASMLGDALMNLLDCREQQKAAAATDEVVRGARVGNTVEWESESRPGVRGSSTVTAVENNAADGECMTVTDVVIVDGEETRAPKRMCRRPPNNRYVRV
jgi:surface antigen